MSDKPWQHSVMESEQRKNYLLNEEIEKLRSELEASKSMSINRDCLLEFTKAYESLRAGTDCHISDSDVSNAFARAVEAVNSELERTK